MEMALAMHSTHSRTRRRPSPQEAAAIRVFLLLALLTVADTGAALVHASSGNWTGVGLCAVIAAATISAAQRRWPAVKSYLSRP